MADNISRTALTAEADQNLAEMAHTIDAMVTAQRAILANGRDRTVAVGMLIMANLATADHFTACQLLAVAVAKLADAPDRPDPLGEGGLE